MIPFGKYKGESIEYVIRHNPSYAMWAHKNVWWFNMKNKQVEECVRAINKKLGENQLSLFAGYEFDDIPF